MTLLTPLYCPNCQHLALLHPLGLLEIKGRAYHEHSCKLYKKKNILESQEIKDAPKVTEETTEFFIAFPKVALPIQKKDPAALLVLGIDKDGFIKGFSSHAQLYKIKPLFEEKVHAGQMISMEGCHKIGQKKYRLPKLILLPPPEDFSTLVGTPSDIYRLLLNSTDHNLLEKITAQVVQVCLQEGITPYSVTTAYEEGKGASRASFKRRISFDPSANLLARINEFSFPDTVNISVQQG